MEKLQKQQTITVTIPLEVFDRIFAVMGSRHKVDPDTHFILSSLQDAYHKKYYLADEPIQNDFWADNEDMYKKALLGSKIRNTMLNNYLNTKIKP